MSLILRTAVLAAACGAATLSLAQTVAPPPLPPGHALVRPEAGMSEPERKRQVRAHHHKFHHKKDYTRDDSVHGHESEVVRTSTQPAGASGQPAARAAGQGGPGSGPAREKTDRGASSWFHGQPDSKK